MDSVRKALAATCVLAAGALFATVASATPLTITITQQGNNVVAAGGGSADLTGFTTSITNTFPASLNPGPGSTWVLFGDTAGSGYTVHYLAGSGPQGFGTGSTQATATSTTGDSLGFEFDGTSFYFFLPIGYSSGNLLSASATWANATYTSLGIAAGTFTWTWGNGADQSFTLDIIPAAIGVPEPAALGLFSGGLLLLGAFLGLRRRMA